MTTSNFLIGPITDGMRKDTRPWSIPEDSFFAVNNAYQYRGRMVRRSGYTKLGQLQILVSSTPGNTDGSGNFTTNLIALYSLPAGAMIVSGSFTAVVGAQTFNETSPPSGLLLDNGSPAAPGSFINYLTTQIGLVTGLPATPVTLSFAYFLGLPVMGLRTQEQFGIDQQSLIAFDTRRSYLWTGTQFDLLPSIMPVIWSGTDYQFFWTINYSGAFWATNNVPGLNGWKITAFAGSAGVGNLATVQVTSPGNNVQVGDSVYFIHTTVSTNSGVLAEVTIAGDPFTVQAVKLPASSTFSWTNGVSSGMVLDSMRTVSGQDGIRYYGVLSNGTGWANYNPPIDLDNALAGALLIFAYRGYLVFLSTWEGNETVGSVVNYPNRARWTQIGTPFYSPPTPQNPNIQNFDIFTARDDLFGRGGANDAPTSEVIVAANFIRDILVVYFERSTWRLRFVNNAQNPFVWERVNTELGSDCTFSQIPFDKGLMAIGNRGIVISDGNDTSRFDEKIPNEIFQIRQLNHGLERVYGIRTFRTRLNFWTFPSSENPTGIYPDQVLVYNYDAKTWSLFDDCFTCFGYFYPSGVGLTWGDLQDAWSSYTNVTWNSGVSESGYENIVAGTQDGYVLKLEQGDSQNDPSLFISAITDSSMTNVTAIFTSPNNNIPNGTWITLENIAGVTSDDGVSLNGRNFKIANPTLDPNTFTLTEFRPIVGPNASGTSYTYTISYKNLFAGSIQINIGSLVFTDPNVNGVLVEASGLGSGNINYLTGKINLTFNPTIGSTVVNIRIVTLDPNQGFDYPVNTLGTYVGAGEISRISGIDITTKIFNFMKDNQKARLQRIDFYMDRTSNGQFTVNVWADSSNVPVNTPLSDNALQNIVLTSASPYQVGQGDETIYRLYCDASASTLQWQITLSDYQLATNCIAESDIEILNMMVVMRMASRMI